MKSTGWCSSAVLAVLALAVSPAGGDTESAARAAIVAAVQERMGPNARVSVSALELRWRTEPAGPVVAQVNSGARLGRTLRFTLRGGPAAAGRIPPRLGHAFGTVHVAMPHVRAARAIARGRVLEAEDLRTVDGDVGAIPLRRLPGVASLVGALAVRAIAPDTLLTTALVTVPPLVRSGDRVLVRVKIGDVEATSEAVARQSGPLGKIIRVVNPENRRSFKARIVGAGEVEVMR